ncbi:MAG: hypothetical protein CMQ17_06920 [Gammaproteobacteria bacterium]|nr:hypothetical protein [Gammaproteobacteria bacterium]
MAKKKRLDAMGDLAPKFGVGQDLFPPDALVLKQKFPFRRSWMLILFSGAFFVGFSIPLFSVGDTLGGPSDGSLFSLISVLFSLFWMLGWSVGVFILGVVFFMMLLGRETLYASSETLVLRIGLLGFGLGARYPAAGIRNFRAVEAEKKSATDWRGPHLAFDYCGETVEFGSHIDANRAAELLAQYKSLYPVENTPPPVIAKEPGRVSTAEEVSSSAAAKHVAATAPHADARFKEQVSFWSPSSLALLGANLIPLFGVLLDDWSIFEVMILFWAESAVIGFYNLLKMWVIGKWSVLFSGPFFIGHFGGFMIVHLMFIYGFFNAGLESNADISTAEVLADLIRLAPALAAFFISHGISYYVNFLGRREYEGKEIGAQMGEPYKRIVIMHLTIIFGGFLVMVFGSVLPALLLLIVLKLGADLRAHIAQHN